MPSLPSTRVCSSRAFHRAGLKPLIRAGLLTFAALCASAARAQDAPASDVIGAAQLTEERLLNALAPNGDVRKRSLRVKATDASATITQPPRPSASLLVTFHTASAELTEQARQQLDVVGAALKNDRLANYRFTVEGHADPRGNPQSNLTLSQHRAGSVRAYLVDTHGIAPQRLLAEGKGDRELLNPAQPAAPENRRVTIVTQMQ